MLHVLKRSCNAHIMFIFGHFTVYAYRTSDIFCKKTLEIFISRQETISRMKLLDFVIDIRLITTLKNVDMFKIIEFIDLCIPHLQLKALQNFHLHLWKIVLFVHDFQTWWRVQSILKCKYFLLFYHNNVC